MSSAGFLVINPYLLTGLYGLATVIIFWLMAGPQRMLMLLAGAITLPFFPLAALFNGEYWTPVRLGGGPLGLEDALYSFALGARAWFLAASGVSCPVCGSHITRRLRAAGGRGDRRRVGGLYRSYRARSWGDIALDAGPCRPARMAAGAST